MVLVMQRGALRPGWVSVGFRQSRGCGETARNCLQAFARESDHTLHARHSLPKAGTERRRGPGVCASEEHLGAAQSEHQNAAEECFRRTHRKAVNRGGSPAPGAWLICRIMREAGRSKTLCKLNVVECISAQESTMPEAGDFPTRNMIARQHRRQKHVYYIRLGRTKTSW